MAFLKKISRGGVGILKQADHGLRYLDRGLHTAGSLIHQSHVGYRTVKRLSTKAIPGAGLAFTMLEMTPEAKVLNQYRQDAENTIGKAERAVETARVGLSLTNRGINNPALKRFIHGS